MKAIHLATLTALAAVSAWASSPVVSNVSLEQKSAKRAEITYTLSEDAVVTLDIVTNAPGPQFPLYAGGARMLEMYPVPPLVRNPFAV